MGFPQSVANEALIRCSRHCCICNKFAGLSIELHHIKQEADGGDNSLDNCIPLCCNCHAIVKAYNPHHPRGRKFTEAELKGHRDKCYALHSMHSIPENPPDNEKFKDLFPKRKDARPNIRWGFFDQEKVCPLAPGMLALIAGYTGEGKSTYIQHIVNYNLNQNAYVAYCCLKESPHDIGCNIIAVASLLNRTKVKQGTLTEDEWKKVSFGLSEINEEGLALLSPDDLPQRSESIITLVENSGADIVVIDDFGALFLEGDTTVERFMYRLKQAATRSGSIVFIVCNIKQTANRIDKHPMLRDFPSDSYYRICDIVQLLFRPAAHYEVDGLEKNILETTVVKGSTPTCTLEMIAIDEITHITSYDPTSPPEPSNEALTRVF